MNQGSGPCRLVTGPRKYDPAYFKQPIQCCFLGTKVGRVSYTKNKRYQLAVDNEINIVRTTQCGMPLQYWIECWGSVLSYPCLLQQTGAPCICCYSLVGWGCWRLCKRPLGVIKSLIAQDEK